MEIYKKNIKKNNINYLMKPSKIFWDLILIILFSLIKKKQKHMVMKLLKYQSKKNMLFSNQ